jgi:antitoxin VapB
MAENLISAAQLEESFEKRRIIHTFMERNQLDGLIIGRQNNFAWATGGSNNWVSIASDTGAATLVYNRQGKSYVVLQNIEKPRFEFEEGMRELGYEIVPQPWWESGDDKRLALLELAGGVNRSLGADFGLDDVFNVAPALARERWQLTPQECERYREVGKLSGEALEEVAANIMPGMTEWEIAGRMAAATYARGMIPFVTLVATDERVWKYRHPIPTGKKLEKYAMLVLCAKKGGLVASCTRQVHFGAIDPELSRRHQLTQRIDATFNLATLPGVVVKDIFAKAMAEYAAAGFPDEWQLHHQGGATGYEARDYTGNPTSGEKVLEWQAFAWNPSITGTKCEDTILVSSEKGMEVLTSSPVSQWPKTSVEIEGLGTMARPDILVL